MNRVIIESPYGNKDSLIVARNILYVRACIRDSLLRGESPIASHALYTQPRILDDQIPEERALGIAAGHVWIEVAHLMAIYEDFGLSPGMEQGMRAAQKISLPVVFRRLPEAVLKGIQ